jgi:hypothetical protein
MKASRKSTHSGRRLAQSRRTNMQRRIMRQKKALLSLSGIGASGFADISVGHDTYLHEKP